MTNVNKKSHKFLTLNFDSLNSQAVKFSFEFFFFLRRVGYICSKLEFLSPNLVITKPYFPIILVCPMSSVLQTIQ